MKQILVIGAAGDVGNGVTAALLEAGHAVIGVSRSEIRLQPLLERYRDRLFRGIVGSVEDDGTARELISRIRAAEDPIDAVVVSVSGRREPARTLIEWDSLELLRTFRENFLPHFVAIRSLIPALHGGGVYVSISGGMTDRVIAGYGYNSIAQAAQRVMTAYVSREIMQPIFVRELMISALVTTANRKAPPDFQFNSVRDIDVGRNVRAIIEHPEEFAGPILLMDSADGVLPYDCSSDPRDVLGR